MSRETPIRTWRFELAFRKCGQLGSSFPSIWYRHCSCGAGGQSRPLWWLLSACTPRSFSMFQMLQIRRLIEAKSHSSGFT